MCRQTFLNPISNSVYTVFKIQKRIRKKMNNKSSLSMLVLIIASVVIALSVGVSTGAPNVTAILPPIIAIAAAFIIRQVMSYMTQPRLEAHYPQILEPITTVVQNVFKTKLYTICDATEADPSRKYAPGTAGHKYIYIYIYIYIERANIFIYVGEGD